MELILVFLVAGIIIKIFVKPDNDALIYNQAVVWVANVVMLALVWAGLKLRGEDVGHFGLGLKKVGPKEALRVFLWSLLVFVLALAGFVVGSIIMANLLGVPENADMGGYAFLKDNLGMLILSCVGVYIVSSFGEEVVYRAFLINRISELGWGGKKGEGIAVVISAIVFGLAHYSWGPMGIVQTAFMGLVLGLCYVALKKRLWILVLAHVYLDTLLLLQIYFA